MGKIIKDRMQEIFPKLKDTEIQTERALLVNKNYSVFYSGDHMSAAAAAAAAESLQSCPTLCNPTDGSPPGSPVPGILQARTLEWVAISFSNA